jgi:hypothetical protein
MTLTFMKQWREMVGTDFVAQALAHIEDRDKQSLLGQWAKLSNG